MIRAADGTAATQLVVPPGPLPEGRLAHDRAEQAPREAVGAQGVADGQLDHAAVGDEAGSGDAASRRIRVPPGEPGRSSDRAAASRPPMPQAGSRTVRPDTAARSATSSVSASGVGGTRRAVASWNHPIRKRRVAS